MFSGLLAGSAALAVAELTSVGVRPEAGPVTAVGGAVIDRTPAAVKDFAIRTFGSQDKLVLQLGIVALLVLFALALGLLALRRRRTGAAGVLLFGVIGAAAAVERPDAGPADAVPAAVGALAGAVVLYLLAGRLGGVSRIAVDQPPGGTSRRSQGESGAVHRKAEDRPRTGVPHAEGQGSTWMTPTTLGAPPGEARGRGAVSGVGGPRGSGKHPLAQQPLPASESTAPDGGGVPRAAATRSAAPGSFDRRGFTVVAGAVVAGSTGAGLLGRRLNASRRAEAAASRATVELPAPASRAAPVPRGAELGIDGLEPFITPDKDFYRVDTALSVPRVDVAAWKLRIHGKGVTRPLTLDFAGLLDRKLIERHITLTCVSNQVGGSYAGNARWLGVPLAELLTEAGVRPPSKGGPADQLVARSVDGMTLGSPVETVMDGRDAMLAVGMNGEPLSFTHGFPVRMLVPGLYGYVSACKWLRDLELTTFDDYDVYWVKRDWAREAPVKTQSRIDTPKPLAALEPGTVQVAGVAWAQHRGIDRVEVRVDDGPWRKARLAEEDNRDTWRQWVWEWRATSGNHRLQVRATDRGGETQTAERVGTVPDGATGRHSVVVDVT
ncbi:MAG TPA: molybdopterin-dependent oxidoreductase [Streptomyces sp.]|nr:molybdopterin-dependent oxidoreductase [Streptomyces sp.]